MAKLDLNVVIDKTYFELNLEIVRLVKRCIVLERIIIALSVALIGLIVWWMA